MNSNRTRSLIRTAIGVTAIILTFPLVFLLALSLGLTTAAVVIVRLVGEISSHVNRALTTVRPSDIWKRPSS